MKVLERIIIFVLSSANNLHVVLPDMYSRLVALENLLPMWFFAGNGLIYENGSLLARSERFSMKEQLIISEIDVERIRAERRINTTFVR